MAKKKEKPKEGPRMLLAYVGVDVSNGKILHSFIRLDEDWKKKKLPKPSPKDLRLYKSRLGHGRPGAVISIEHGMEDGSEVVLVHTAEWVDNVDDDTATEWQSKSQAVQSARDLEVHLKKQSNRDLPLEVLEPLRTAYKSLRDKNKRTVFLARVMAYLTK